MSDLALHDYVQKLALLREEVAQRSEQIRKERATFDTSIADQTGKLEAIERACEAADADVRGLALVAYETQGTKAPAAGVSVVMTKDFAIDEAAALVWAKASNMCLVPESVDLKAVKKIATVQSLHFVTVTETPSVRIATDLAKALNDVAYDRSTRAAA